MLTKTSSGKDTKELDYCLNYDLNRPHTGDTYSEGVEYENL